MNGTPTARPQPAVLADRPMQIRVFTEAWPGEQPGEVGRGLALATIRFRLNPQRWPVALPLCVRNENASSV
jgi:hypothetical protein